MFDLGFPKDWSTIRKLIFLKRAGIAGGSDPLSTMTGSLVRFTSSASKPVKQIVGAVEPVQDLHGYDNPWPAGGGKNKADPDSFLLTNVTYSNGVYSASDGDTAPRLRFKIQQRTSNGTFIDGTQEVTNYITSVGRISLTTTIVEGAYYLRFANNGSQTEFQIRIPCSQFAVGTTLTFSANITDITVGACKFKDIQIEVGSTATSFAPYTNICPITGWTGANVYGTGVNVWDEEWEQGSIDITTGQNAPSGSSIRSKNYISVKPSESYYFYVGTEKNALLFGYYADKTYKGLIKAGGSNYVQNKVVDIPSDVYYVRFRGVDVSTYSDNISLNSPSSDTSYHAHTGNTLTISFPSRNLVTETLTGKSINDSGQITNYSAKDMHIAKVESGVTYYISATDTGGGCVYGFFTSEPAFGSTSYDGTRTVTNVKTVVAPITGYIAFRSDTGASARIEEGTFPTTDTVYGGSYTVNEDGSGELTITHVLWQKNTADMNNNSDYPGWKECGIADLIGYGFNGQKTQQIMNIGDRYNANTTNTSNTGTLFLSKSAYGKTQDEWKALAIDVQIAVELATPITITFSSVTMLNTLEGVNNMWQDTGDITVQAYGVEIVEPQLNSLQSLNLLLGNGYVNNHTQDDVSDDEALDIILGGNER